jgi:hypothetical protein
MCYSLIAIACERVHDEFGCPSHCAGSLRLAHDDNCPRLRPADRGIGGLIGLGGGEFGLPILVALIGFTARAVKPMN